MTITFISFDPGENTGVTLYNEKGHLQQLEVIHHKKINEWLRELVADDIITCIIEDYRVYPNKAKAHIYSDVKTVAVIGRLEYWAEAHEIKIVKQPASLKTTGFKYLGIAEPPRSNPRSHGFVAHAHATFYFVKNGILDPKELLNAKKN